MSTLRASREITVIDTPVTATPPRSSVFRDAVLAELMKIRTLRSTRAFVVGGLLATALGALILFFLVQSYDASSVAERAAFEPADATVVTMPFVMFFIGSIGVMLITSEFTTKSIGPSLIAVPQRLTLLCAKATVAALVGLVAGLLFSLLSVIDARLVFGDRPKPFNPWPQFTDGIPTVLSSTAMVMVTCLVALGLGALMRSTAAALTTLGALVLVAPIFAHFLPTTWEIRFGSILLPNLTQQLADGNDPYVLSQGGAAVIAVVYLLLTVGAGAISFSRRDAS